MGAGSLDRSYFIESSMHCIELGPIGAFLRSNRLKNAHCRRSKEIEGGLRKEKVVHVEGKEG